MARFIRLASLTAALLSIAAPATPINAQQVVPSGAPIELKLKWPIGTKYVYRMEFDQESSFTPPGQPGPMKQEVNMGQEFAFNVVKELEGGRREVEFEWLAISMDMSMGGNSVVKYDSRKPDAATGAGASAISGSLGKLVGLRLRYIMGANGRVEKVEGLQEIASKLNDGNPATEQMTKSFLDENQLKRLMDAAYLPDRPVKPGDTWPLNIEMPMPPLGSLKLQSTMTFTGMEERKGRQCAALKTVGTFTMDQAKAPQEGQPVSMNIEKGTQEGTSWFDPEAGALVDSTVKQKFTMLMTMKSPTGAGGDPQTMTMDMVQDIAMTMVSSEKTAK